MNAQTATSTPASMRTRVQRHPKRGVYDRDTIHRIIDEALICHVAIVEDDGQPFVMPVIHTRVDDAIYIHGSRGSRLLTRLAEGAAACATMTIIDGLVLARSAMHHSMNPRSVVVLGRGWAVEDDATKRRVWAALVDHVIPGRSRDCRMPFAQESAATMLVAIGLNEASAKIRAGGPIDNADDLQLPHWAGVLQLSLQPRAAVRDALLAKDIATPDYVAHYSRS